MGLPRTKLPFLIVLLLLGVLAFFLRNFLTVDVTDLWSKKGKAFSEAYTSVACITAPTDEEYLLANAKSGYRDAMGMLAMRYVSGWNRFRKDINEGLKWYRIAADEGAAGAQFFMGALYAPEINKEPHEEINSPSRIAREAKIETDYVEAAKWWQKAANQGFWPAQRNLSVLYQDGLGVKQDYVEADFWMSLALKQHPELHKERDAILNKLTYEQLESLRPRILDWKPEKIEPAKKKVLINVARLICGGRTEAGSYCSVTTTCGHMVAIDCGLDNDRGSYYFADKQTNEIVAECRFDVCTPPGWTCNLPRGLRAPAENIPSAPRASGHVVQMRGKTGTPYN
jgi:hypothetical protein